MEDFPQNYKEKMKRKDKKLTLDEHMEVADDLAIAFHHLKKAFDKCEEHYPISSKLMNFFYQLHPGNVKSKFCNLKDQLDEEYHKLITEEEFKVHGHIYYKLNERYKKIQRDNK
ncbi:MAG: hypothetical protein Q3M30_19760 [Candidatus Electrothrix sp. Rat3]|nr:hypothetical protein [Candidatus Electrothrix rattekaaiensis]